MSATRFVPLEADESVQRILTWCRMGCALLREGGRWRLQAPAEWTHPRGPAPRPISEATAQAAIAAGTLVAHAPDLFDGERVAA